MEVGASTARSHGGQGWTNTQSDKIQTRIMSRISGEMREFIEVLSSLYYNIQKPGHSYKLGASAGQSRYSAALSTFSASHLSPFCGMLFGGSPLRVVIGEALDVEGIKESNVPRPIVIPAAPVIRTFDLEPFGVKI